MFSLLTTCYLELFIFVLILIAMKNKILLVCLMLSAGITRISFSQNLNPEKPNSGDHHYIEYTFQLTEGLNHPDDAEKADQIMQSLKGLVASSKTDYESHYIKVQVYDARITFESLVYVLELSGFKASALISTKNEEN